MAFAPCCYGCLTCEHESSKKFGQLRKSGISLILRDVNPEGAGPGHCRSDPGSDGHGGAVRGNSKSDPLLHCCSERRMTVDLFGAHAGRLVVGSRASSASM